MILVKKPYLLALSLLFLGCNNTQYTKEQAQQLLHSVEKQYKSMETFELEGAVNTTVSAAGQNQNMSIPVYYAQDGSGKSRIEIKSKQLGMVKISNDSTSWSYIPSLKEYKKQKVAMLQIGDRNGTNDILPSTGIAGLASKFTDTFKTISRGMKEATILGEETVTMTDGSKREAFKLKVAYQNATQPQNMTTSPTTYLIGKKDHVVLKQSVEMKASDEAPRGPFTIYTTYLLKAVDLAPSFSDSVFVFNPPQGAREVEDLSTDMQNNTSNTSALVGGEAKNFTLTSFSGERLNLNDLKGKVVVLDFWATWCGPCREAHPNLQSLYEDLKDKGLVVLGINSETAKKVDSYMQTKGYTFTNLKDPNQSVAINYQVNSIPSVFIIDKKGIVSDHLLGYQSKERLRKAINDAGL